MSPCQPHLSRKLFQNFDFAVLNEIFNLIARAFTILGHLSVLLLVLIPFWPNLGWFTKVLKNQEIQDG